jgi:hypothetical protein
MAKDENIEESVEAYIVHAGFSQWLREGKIRMFAGSALSIGAC